MLNNAERKILSAKYAGRLHHRHPLDVRARVMVHPENSAPHVVQARTRNVSPGGVELLLTSEVEAGTAVVLWLRVPEPMRHFCVAGVIRHRRGLRAGVQFQGLSAEQKLILHQICR